VGGLTLKPGDRPFAAK